MTNRKTTRRALVMSLLSLLLCCSMLVGTTFAWFTDSVTSGKNKIIAGNLDVELYYKLNANDQWAKVTSETELFDDAALWEPGYTQVVYLKVANEGTLALKYQLGVNIIAETQGKNVDNEMFKLSDYIKFDAIETAEPNFYTDRDEARKAVTDPQIISAGYGKASQLLAAEEGKESAEYVTLVVYMPEETNNKANYREVKPEITLGVNLVATQLTHESDSFNNKYDEKAEYLPVWNGEAGEVPEADTNGVITITTAEELAAFAAAVNAGTSYSGKTVQLAADINLANKPWTPIGACDGPAYFQGTFDGQGHTIYGLNVDKSADDYMYSTAGFFGWIDTGAATIKNVNISGATVKGSHWVGALVGYMSGTVENCTVSNSSVVGVHVTDDADGDKVGGLVGYLNKGALISNTVANTTVSANRDLGGLVGAVVAGQTLTGNKVENVTLAYVTEKSYASAGEIVSGRTGFVPDNTNTATNVQIIKGTEEIPGVVVTADEIYQVTSKEGLLNVRNLIDTTTTGEGVPMKIKLMADIDLAGENWKAIDKMWVEFDGNGHTISNLKAEGLKAGLFGYLGGGIIKNLTLENVHTTGAQAGTFAGAVEGTIENCTLKGNNSVTYAPYVTEDYTETWGGIGAICGVAQPMVVNATIAEGATVTLNYGAIETNAPYVDQLTGYISKTNGTIVNNGEIIVAVNDTAALIDAIKNAPVGQETTVSLASGTYAGNMDITVAALGASGGDVVIKAAEGATPVITGTVTLGYHNQTVGATMYNANVTFEGITFDHANAATHSLDVQDVKSLTLKNCTIIGDGEYGITSARGNATGTSKIVDCTFKNAGMQLLGNLATGLVIERCTFEDSCINVQGGNGVTVQNCTFDNTLTDAHLGNGFYLVRSNSTPITVKDCKATIDSTVTGVAAGQAKWYLLANRGTTNWTVENVEITMTDAALAQTELKVTACTSTGLINTTNLTVNGTVQ